MSAVGNEVPNSNGFMHWLFAPIAKKMLYVGSSSSEKKLNEAEEGRKTFLNYWRAEQCEFLISGDAIVRGMYFDNKKWRSAARIDPSIVPEFDCETKLNAKKNATVMICFGNAELYARKTHEIVMFLLRGFNVQTFNYPGYDDSEGDPSPQTLLEAGERVYRSLRERVGQDATILLYGISLGSGIVCHLARNYHSEKMVVLLDRAYSKLSTVSGEFTKSKIVGFAVSKLYEFDNVENMKNYQGPLVILRAAEDEMCEAHHATELHRAWLVDQVNLDEAFEKEVIFEMPGGHGFKVDSWIDASNRKDGLEVFDRALQQLGICE